MSTAMQVDTRLTLDQAAGEALARWRGREVDVGVLRRAGDLDAGFVGVLDDVEECDEGVMLRFDGHRSYLVVERGRFEGAAWSEVGMFPPAARTLTITLGGGLAVELSDAE